MLTLRYSAALVVLACGTFAAAARVARRSAAVAQLHSPVAAADVIPDSVQLASIGLRPGNQLVAYVFGSSRCGYCQSDAVKSAVAGLRDSLRRYHGSAFPTIAIVGVAVNTDLDEGLGYLKAVGLTHFDEIAIGKGWQNEQVIRWVRRARVAEAGVPLIVVSRRDMTAKLNPISVSYSSDSVVRVLQGRDSVVSWVAHGTPLDVDRR